MKLLTNIPNTFLFDSMTKRQSITNFLNNEERIILNANNIINEVSFLTKKIYYWFK